MEYLVIDYSLTGASLTEIPGDPGGPVGPCGPVTPWTESRVFSVTEANGTVLPLADRSTHLISPGSWCTLVAGQASVSLLPVFPRGANQTDQASVTLQTETQPVSIQNAAGGGAKLKAALETHFLSLAAGVSPQSRKSRRSL